MVSANQWCRDDINVLSWPSACQLGTHAEQRCLSNGIMCSL